MNTADREGLSTARTAAANLVFTLIIGIFLFVSVDSGTLPAWLQGVPVYLAIALVLIGLFQLFMLLKTMTASGSLPVPTAPAPVNVPTQPVRLPSPPIHTEAERMQNPVSAFGVSPGAPAPVTPAVRYQPVPMLTGPPDLQLASLLSSPLTLWQHPLPAGDRAVLVKAGESGVLIKIYTGYQRIDDLQGASRTKVLRPLLQEIQGMTLTSALLWLPSDEGRRSLDASGAVVFSGTATQLAGLLEATLTGGTTDGPVVTPADKQALLDELANSLPAHWKLVRDVPMDVSRPVDVVLVYQTSLAVAVNLFAPAAEYLLPEFHRQFRWDGVLHEDSRPSNFVAQVDAVTGLHAVAWIPDRRMDLVKALTADQTVLIGGPERLLVHLTGMVAS